MNIAVCMKQVPAVSEGNMDPETGVLIRSGLEAVPNIYDLSALEAALQIREQTKGKITVFTMGPQKAKEVIRTAYSMGADKGYLLCDKAFAGADVLATAYTLAQAIRHTGNYDLILCGKQTTDGDTAQVSGSLARHMNLPHLNWVTDIQIRDEQKIGVCYSMEQRNIWASVTLPCLLSVEKEAFWPRMPSLKLKISGKRKEIGLLTLAEFEDKDEHRYGLKGSATCVRKVFPPPITRKYPLAKISGKDAADYILSILNKEKGES